MRDLAEEPGPPIGAAPDYHPIGARAGERLAGAFRGGDIAIDDDRDGDRLLHLANKGPIGASLIELAAGAAMDGHHADAAFLRDPREAWRVAVRLVPAGAHLECHRQFDGAHHRLEDARGLAFVAHQCRTGMAVHHLLDRTAEIDVDEGGAAIFIELRRLRHHRRLAAGELHRHRVFLRRGRGHQHGLAGLPDHRLARDHLGNHQPHPLLLHQAAKRQVRHPRHGRQNHRILEGQAIDRNAHFLCNSYVATNLGNHTGPRFAWQAIGFTRGRFPHPPRLREAALSREAGEGGPAAKRWGVRVLQPARSEGWGAPLSLTLPPRSAAGPSLSHFVGEGWLLRGPHARAGLAAWAPLSLTLPPRSAAGPSLSHFVGEGWLLRGPHARAGLAAWAPLSLTLPPRSAAGPSLSHFVGEGWLLRGPHARAGLAAWAPLSLTLPPRSAVGPSLSHFVGEGWLLRGPCVQARKGWSCSLGNSLALDYRPPMV